MNKKIFISVFLVSLVLASAPVFSWEKTIPINYYMQAVPGWTGPATAQMILTSPIITAEPSFVSKTQAELLTYISAHNDPGWTAIYPGDHTDPIAMQECLIEYDTRTWITYVIKKTPTYDAVISQDIVYTIAHYDVPPAVPIDGGLNWVAVFAVNTTGDPMAGTYSINWFKINDPRDPVLGNNRMISYTSWENSGASSVFLHISTPDPYPDNLIKLAICDPEDHGPLQVQAPLPLPRREIVLTPGEAKEAALKALEQYNMFEQPGYRDSEKGIKSGSPVLVKRTAGKMNADYYIVPMVKRYFFFWKRLTGAILIDAYSGAFLETSLAQKPVYYPYLSYSLARVKNLLISKLKKQEGIGSTDISVGTPTLTWAPGLSVNPYFPLWKTRATVKGVDQIRYLDFDNNILPLKNLRPGRK